MDPFVRNVTKKIERKREKQRSRFKKHYKHCVVVTVVVVVAVLVFCCSRVWLLWLLLHTHTVTYTRITNMMTNKVI